MPHDARNPFTSQSRDHVMSLHNGVVGKLRAGETLYRAIVARKPQHQGLGDFALKSMYDAPLIDLIRAGRYRDLQATLAEDWGPLPTAVADPHERSAIP